MARPKEAAIVALGEKHVATGGRKTGRCADDAQADVVACDLALEVATASLLDYLAQAAENTTHVLTDRRRQTREYCQLTI